MNKPFVFITGATAGFGKACAETFAREGYSLVINKLPIFQNYLC